MIGRLIRVSEHTGQWELLNARLSGKGAGFKVLGLGFRRSHSDNPGEACGSRSDEVKLGFRVWVFWG